jgi:uncharacterized protein (TIGR03083 family)
MRAYGAEKSSVSNLYRGIDGEAARLTVPATPEWNVHDVLAHLVGGCQSQAEDTTPPEPESDIMKVLVGWNTPERTAARNAWTAEMVEARRSSNIAELLEEWDRWERAAVITVNRGGLSAMRLPALVTDLVCHAQDVRAALGLKGETAPEAARLTLNSLLFFVDLRISDAELPALRIEDDKGRVLSGKQSQGVVLRGTQYELIRALAGRRTPAQVEAMFSGGAGAAYVPLIPLYDPPASPLPE